MRISFDRRLAVHRALAILFTVILLGTTLVPMAQAGDWSYEVLGPGTTPSTVRVRIHVTADIGTQCEGRMCIGVIGNFRGRITPAPPVQSGPTCGMDTFVIDALGADFSTFCSGTPGESSGWEDFDLDPTVTYTFDNARHSFSWLIFGQGGLCVPNEFCNSLDEQFAPLVVSAGPVAAAMMTWSVLKSRY